MTHPKFIPNIYNYCDNWCENCKFTANCEFYVQSHSFANNLNENDPDDFWEEFLALIKKDSFIESYSPPETPYNLLKDTKVFKEKLKREKAALHIITKLGHNYIDMVDDFLKIYNEKFENINLLNSDTNLNSSKTNKIIACMDTIKWYQPQIYVKISRAVYSLLKETENNNICTQSDSNGSAKVALIAIERSIQSWNELINHNIEEDAILKLLVFLDKLKKNILNYFPQAYDYIRPGFDE